MNGATTRWFHPEAKVTFLKGGNVQINKENDQDQMLVVNKEANGSVYEADAVICILSHAMCFLLSLHLLLFTSSSINTFVNALRGVGRKRPRCISC